jgi:hypothetical protein
MTTFELQSADIDLRPTFARWERDFYESWPDDLKAAFLAGCEIEYGSQMTPEGLHMTARTKDKIGVVREAGRVTVYAQR